MNYVSQSIQSTYKTILHIESGSMIFDGTGSQFVNADITSSYAVSASYAPSLPVVSCSYADTSSWSQNALTASSINFSINSASYSVNASTASYVVNAISSSHSVNADTASYVVSCISSSYLSGSDPVVSSSIKFGAAGTSPKFRTSGNDLFLERNDGATKRSLTLGNITATGNASISGITDTATLNVSNLTATKIIGGYFEQVTRMSKYWDFLNYTSSGVGGSNFQTSNAEGWLVNTGSIMTASAESNHPGIITRRTSAVANQVNGFFPGGNLNSTCTTLEDSDRFRVIMNMVTGSISQSVRIGLFDNMTNDPPTNGIYFEKTGSRTEWLAVARSASLQWSGSTGVNCTSSNVWRNFLITGLDGAGGSVDFYIDSDSAPVISWIGDVINPMSLTLPMTFGIQIVPKQAVTFDNKIDFIRYDSVALER